MRIENMELRDWGNTKATFSLVVEEAITISCKIVLGRNGLFVSFPREKGKDDNWYDRVTMPRELRDNLTVDAVAVYKKVGGADQGQSDDGGVKAF